MTPGVNRIWYKSAGFKEGQEVKVQFTYPDLTKSGIMPLNEMSDGLYYVDFDFIFIGNYAAIFFEGVEKSTFKSFDIFNTDHPGIVAHG